MATRAYVHNRAFRAESLMQICTAGRALLHDRALSRNFARLAVFRSTAMHPLIFNGYKPIPCKKRASFIHCFYFSGEHF